MARYTTEYYVGKELVLYLESEGDEEVIDEEHGDGYLKFWHRSKTAIMEHEQAYPQHWGKGVAWLHDNSWDTKRQIWGC